MPPQGAGAAGGDEEAPRQEPPLPPLPRPPTTLTLVPKAGCHRALCWIRYRLASSRQAGVWARRAPRSPSCRIVPCRMRGTRIFPARRTQHIVAPPKSADAMLMPAPSQRRTVVAALHLCRLLLAAPSTPQNAQATPVPRTPCCKNEAGGTWRSERSHADDIPRTMEGAPRRA